MARWAFAPVDCACGYCGARILAASPMLKVGNMASLTRCQTCGEKYLPFDAQALADAKDLADERAAIQWEGQPHLSKPAGFVKLGTIATNFDPKKKQAHDED